MGRQIMDGPLKWHGGKHYLAKKINSLFQPHITYVDLYMGGGSVLLEHDPTNSAEVANDLNGELINFWHVLKTPSIYNAFKRMIDCTPFSEQLFNETSSPTTDPVQRAVNFFIRCRQSRQGLGKDFATLTKNRLRRGMNEQVSAWLTCIEGLDAVHERLQRVMLLCRPAIDVIKQLDTPHTLFYADPPYMQDTRKSYGEYGQFEMTDSDHVKLLHELSKIQGKFVLSGYPSELYAMAEERYSWKHLDILTPNHSSSSKIKEEKIERVWYNF